MSENSIKHITEFLKQNRFSPNEIRVYLYLTKFGLSKASQIADSLKLHRTEVYKITTRLQRRGMVDRVLGRPFRFLVVPLDRAIDALVIEVNKELVLIENSREELVKDWGLILRKDINKAKNHTLITCVNHKTIAPTVIAMLRSCKKMHIMIYDKILYKLHHAVFQDIEESKKEIHIATNSKDKNLSFEGENIHTTYIDNPKNFFLTENEILIVIDDELTCLKTNITEIIDVYKMLFDSKVSMKRNREDKNV